MNGVHYTTQGFGTALKLPRSWFRFSKLKILFLINASSKSYWDVYRSLEMYQILFYSIIFKWNFQILSTYKATDFFSNNLLGCRYRKRFLPKSADRGDSGSETWVYYVFEYMCEQIECTLQFICLYRSGHCGWVPVFCIVPTYKVS